MMTLAEYEAHVEAWRALCLRVRVRGALPVSFRAYGYERATSAVEIVCLMDTIERCDNTAKLVRFTNFLRGAPSVEKLRDSAREIYKHELREQFRHRDQIVHDPHACFGDADQRVLGTDSSCECWKEFCAQTVVRGPLAIAFDIHTLEWGDDRFVESRAEVEPVTPLARGMIAHPAVARGKIMISSQGDPIAPHTVPSTSYLLHYAEELYMHELDEQFYVDDERPFDPHRPVITSVTLSGTVSS